MLLDSGQLMFSFGRHFKIGQQFFKNRAIEIKKWLITGIGQQLFTLATAFALGVSIYITINSAKYIKKKGGECPWIEKQKGLKNRQKEFSLFRFIAS